MAKTPRVWSELDKAIMAIIIKARDAMPQKPTLRETEDATGISRSRVSDLYHEKNGSPSLQEFISLCLVYGLLPSNVLEEANQMLQKKAQPSDEDRAKLALERAQHAAEYGLAAMEGEKRHEEDDGIA
ncbi:hypothetical protein [Bifidobacterium pseudolongum]|uniref:hypothetical protein n=1 Tax=Bifidobacterium pseudolongum TaxID=1694 RepID=UPI0020A18BA2|nr:hypothetical protein [Bifidobacterium pseudolongum]